jgi:hypothetical protein
MIYIVSGFIRSGTSACMQALEAGGLSVVKDGKRKEFNWRHKDGKYTPNPDDLYEPNMTLWTHSWPRQYDGMAIKLVVPYCRRISAHNYKVLFMMRDPEEIRQSAEGSFGIRVKTQQIETQRSEALAVLRNRRDVKHIEVVQYQDLIENPLEIFTKLNWPIDAKKAATVITPSQYRYRLDDLVVGL